MDEKGVQSFLIVFSIIAFFLALTVILLFVLFQKRKNKLLQQQQQAESRFKEELIETQIEIREETLRNISWELHDNIGQLLTLAKIQLQSMDEQSANIIEATETIGKSLIELRSLSKLINPDTFNKLTLIEGLQLEIERLNRLGYIDASLTFTEAFLFLDKKTEIIIFRILQEFFTNTIKHSKASQLMVEVTNDSDKLIIMAVDDGIGFNTESLNKDKGIGLSNIKNRASLIGADIVISSQKGVGTQLKLTYNHLKT